jgi:DNA-binding transcriptional regulator YiaG
MSGADIKIFRQSLGLTQQELADELGVTQVAVCNWENGVRRPSGSVLRCIAMLRDKIRSSVQKAEPAA